MRRISIDKRTVQLIRLMANAFLGLTVLAPLARSQDVVVPVKTQVLAQDHKLLEEARKNSEVMKNLTYLSDEIGSRLTGSASLKRANEWTADKMRSYGLTNVHLEPWTIPVGWERIRAEANLVEPGSNRRPMALASMGWTPGTKGKVVGDVVILKSAGATALAAYKGKLKNAIILLTKPAEVGAVADADFPFAIITPRPARKHSSNATDARTRAANMQGMMMAMFIAQGQSMDFFRNEGVAALLIDSGKPYNLLSTMGAWHGTDRAKEEAGVPVAEMGHENYSLLYRLASRPAPAKTRVEIDIENKFIPGPVIVYNTVGEILGSEKPDEFVVVGAHLDSWDLAQGTTDNGTGSMVVLETARVMMRSGLRPKRTIRFVLFSGEEQGLFGSQAYVKRHMADMPHTSLCIVHDTGTGRVIAIGTQGRRPLQPILTAELATLKEVGLTDFNTSILNGSDHQSFEAAGVPGIALQQDMTEYVLTHHSQSDTLDKAREADLIQGVQVMAVTALHVANLPQLLPRGRS